jgi:hypothetical protein
MQPLSSKKEMHVAQSICVDRLAQLSANSAEEHCQSAANCCFIHEVTEVKLDEHCFQYGLVYLAVWQQHYGPTHKECFVA